MEFFLEMLWTAVVAVLFSLLVAKLVSVAVGSGGAGCATDEKSVTDTDEAVITEELQKKDARVLESESRVQFVDETVENVDRLAGEAVGADDVAESSVGKGEIGAESQKLAAEGMEGELPAAESQENAFEEEEKSSNSVAETNTSFEIEKNGDDHDHHGDGDVVVGETDEARVAESELKVRSEEKMEELDMEDDDWEGIERSEVEKAFAAAAKFVEEFGEVAGVGNDVKMELYALHKIVTEGSCHEPQPMALMVSARAKWNAWQKLGNMNPEVAMERYLELLSKEVPGWMEESSAEKIKLEKETSDSTSNRGQGEISGASSLDSKAKDE